MGIRWSPKRTRSVVLACAVMVGGAGVASAASSYPPDPRMDETHCTGECSNYNVDLKTVQLSRSHGNLLIKVTQWGAFKKAQPLYWPQVELYTHSRVPHSDPQAPFTSSSHVADYTIYVGYGKSTCYTNGTGYEMDLYKGTTKVQVVSCQWVSPKAIVYKVPLAKLGKPAKVHARAWQADVSGPRDVAPNTNSRPNSVSG
jgi:hypothetical protein